MTDTPIVFCDTETTHLHPGLRRPWEIALIRRPAMLPATEWEGLPLPESARLTLIIRDPDLSDADPKSLEIGRFYERHPHFSAQHVILDDHTDLVTERDAAELVDDWTAGAQIIGLVPEFDAWTLDVMLRRHGQLPRWHYQTIDVETEAAGWLKGRLHAGDPELSARAHEIHAAVTLPRKSDAVSLLCGVAPPSDEERHTAMGDARWVERWWDALTADTASTGAVA